MSETMLMCRICRHVFSEREARLRAAVEPDDEQLQCPRCGSSSFEPYAFDPDAPAMDPFEEDEEAY
ncbi:hypothetical protein RxyAA322_14840 [Rubrobacter xylanophilus]|uniref:Uncharacterized protein n=1 Tax=Rubrobacter xylanophilus TaxID=49319 RepID=A0A510HI09_9ACTN|nr:hypothetical protein [Rubrobacter xylanophilus]BBL79630.1 hypothetical protein RxyAA322_14840 [Rubrobacter xylanophilus]